MSEFRLFLLDHITTVRLYKFLFENLALVSMCVLVKTIWMVVFNAIDLGKNSQAFD